jgi:D-lactate dehydrogenase (cytochrome)
VNQAKHLGWQETPSLLIELHGLPESIAIEVPVVIDICQQNGGHVEIRATTQEEQTRLWDGRRAVRAAVRTLLPGSGVTAGDIGLPVSAIPAFIERVRAEGEAHHIPTMAYGHAGDGNFHVWAVYAEGDEDSRKRAAEVNEILTGYAIELGGTSTAEHGVAIGKRKFLKQEHASSLETMKAIKRVFDPAGILNPGKIFEE